MFRYLGFMTVAPVNYDFDIVRQALTPYNLYEDIRQNSDQSRKERAHSKWTLGIQPYTKSFRTRASYVGQYSDVRALWHDENISVIARNPQDHTICPSKAGLGQYTNINRLQE